MDAPLAAFDGTNTMVVWTASTTDNRKGATVLWATLQNGTLTNSGTLGYGDTGAGQLFMFNGAFTLFASGSLYQFHSGTWTMVSGFNAAVIAVSGNRILGVDGINYGATHGIIYDGTTVTASQQLSAYTYAAIAGDGSGGLALISIDVTSITDTPVHYTRFDGTSWSADALVTTIPTYLSADEFTAAFGGGVFGFGVRAQNTGVTAWVLSGTTWTSTMVNSDGTDLRMTGSANGLLLAVAASQDSASIYSGGAWSTHSFTQYTYSLLDAVPYGSGFLVLFGGVQDPVYASTFDGSQWSALVQPISNLGGANGNAVPARTAFIGNQIALTAAYYDRSNGGSYSPQVALFDGTSWSSVTTLDAYQAQLPSGVVPVAANGAFSTFFSTATGLGMRTQSGSSWSNESTLPAPSPISGWVMSGSFARASNGHALAAWTQYSADVIHAYASEFDGSTWGTPVDLGLGDATFTVGSIANALVVLAILDDGTIEAAHWNGTGLDVPTVFPQTYPTNGVIALAHDDTELVAVYADNDVYAASTSDGITWTTPQSIDTGDWAVVGASGGPAGVLEWSRNLTSGQVQARIWQGGAWSAASTAMSASNAPGGPTACHGAVSTDAALVACAGGSALDAQWFSAGAWTDVPPNPVATLFSLATDGADFRLDGISTNQAASSLFHAGTWSALAKSTFVSPYPTAPQTNWNAGNCSGWTMLYVDSSDTSFRVTNAAGASAYPVGTTLTGFAWPYSVGFSSEAGATDVAWIGTTPSSGVIYAYVVDLGI